MHKAILVIAALLPGVAAATPICQKYSDQIDTNERLLAQNHADGIGDDSAARESNRLTRENNLLLKNSMTLQLMLQAKCTMPAEADYSVRYAANAANCSIAMLTAQNAAGKFELPAACDSSKWSDQRK